MTNLINEILEQPQQLPALELSGRIWTYGELTFGAAGIAEKLQCVEHDELRVVALLASRSYTAYAGVLAATLARLGYAPLHPKFPPFRTRLMLEQSRARVLIVGKEGLAVLPELLDRESEFLILGPEVEDFSSLSAAYPKCRFVSREEFNRPVPCVPDLDPDGTAYLLFTSGTTGVPKGVPVTRANLQAYVDHISTAYPVFRNDRCSQTFDLTFDLSVHDMFVTWTAGACLCPSQQAALLAPAKFIRERNLTVWFSVPSVAMMMRRSRTLRPEILPSLRLSLFCGEPLPDSIAAGWAEAAPGSKIVNLYGPTEATIAVAAYEWQPSSPEQAQGIVPIGWVFPSQEAVLIDEHRRLQTGAGVGELCLSGSQVTRGYLNQPDKTAEQFVRLTGGGERIWYRTGDLVERGADGCMFFRGRIDNQVKINGYRIELQEIEKVLRSESGADVAIAVTLPPPPAAPERVVGCVAGLKGAVDEVALREACSRKLPDYMVPQRIIEVETLPLNVNGKVDRKALTEIAAGVD